MVKELRPEDLLTQAERFFNDHDIGYLLYTPPYCPSFHPIELFRAYAKGYVANTWQGQTRTMLDTTELLRYGFHGKSNGGTWEVKPPDCAELVKHSMDCADKSCCPRRSPQ